MTDRINRLTVVLDKDFREDDVHTIMNAISMVKGVLVVEPHVADTADRMATVRAQHELREKILDLLR